MVDGRNIVLLCWKTQREESRKNAESCPKLVRRQLYRYFQCRCLVSSVLLLTHNEPQAYLEFGVKAGLHPQVVAALDGCHVPVIVPLQSPEDYVN